MPLVSPVVYPDRLELSYLVRKLRETLADKEDGVSI
jgi:hypothetical protein